jgi:transposase
MAKKYRVRLQAEERDQLESIVKRGKEAARKRMHAHILLKADEGEFGSCWKDREIAKALDVSVMTVERVRERLVMQGLESALNPVKVDRSGQRRLDGEQEAHLIALACSEPPEGRVRWTLQLLADKMVELEYVDSLSDETVRRTLKKNRIKAMAK